MFLLSMKMKEVYRLKLIVNGTAIIAKLISHHKCIFRYHHQNEKFFIYSLLIKQIKYIKYIMADNNRMNQIFLICLFLIYGSNSQEDYLNIKIKQNSKNFTTNKQYEPEKYNNDNVTWSETTLNELIQPKYTHTDHFSTIPMLIYNDDDANQPSILIDNIPPLLFDYDELFNNGESVNYQANEQNLNSFLPKVYLTPPRNKNLKQTVSNLNNFDKDEAIHNCENYPENDVKKSNSPYIEPEFDEVPLPYGQ